MLGIKFWSVLIVYKENYSCITQSIAVHYDEDYNVVFVKWKEFWCFDDMQTVRICLGYYQKPQWL